MTEQKAYEELVMVRLGELFLKGGNRKVFMQRQRQNVLNALRRLTDAFEIEMHNWRYLIRFEDAQFLEKSLEILRDIPGVTSVSLVRGVPTSEEDIRREAVQWATHAWKDKTGSFALRVKRNYKHFPISSMDYARDVGGRIKTNTDMTVSLKKPQHEMHVEIEKEQSYMWLDSRPGVGGLPVGISGKVLLLLSGGIDSPVAGYLAQKRGCLVDAIYFHSPPFISEASRDKVESLAKKLAHRQSKLRLHVVPFTNIQKAIKKNCDGKFTVLLYRRFMYRIASRWAQKFHYDALVTGENVGQVASQTLANLQVVDQISDVLTLRPLLAYDKKEIIRVAEQIDTFELSILPYDDCCTLFVPEHPATKAKHKTLVREEDKLDMDGLIEEAIENLETVEFN